MVATISTGERRSPIPVPLAGLRRVRPETAGIRSMLRPHSDLRGTNDAKRMGGYLSKPGCLRRQVTRRTPAVSLFRPNGPWFSPTLLTYGTGTRAHRGRGRLAREHRVGDPGRAQDGRAAARRQIGRASW